VNLQTYTRTIPPRNSQPWRGAHLPIAHTVPESGPCNSRSIPFPECRPFAWRVAEDDAGHRNVRPTHCLQPEEGQTTEQGSAAVRLRRHPYIDALQTSVSLERHFSRIFPAHPRSLASVYSPRPAALRVSASATTPAGQKRTCRGPRYYAALWVSAFRKSFVQRTQKDLPNLPKKTPLDLGSGAPRVASRRSVPRAIRANTNKEK
jgi:hypothetical protein